MPPINRKDWEALKKANGIGKGEAKVNMGKALDLYEKAWGDKEGAPDHLVKVLNRVLADVHTYTTTIEKKYGSTKKTFLDGIKAKITNPLLQDVRDLESLANPWQNMREEFRELLSLSKQLGTQAQDPSFQSDSKRQEQLLTPMGGIANAIGINLNLLRDVYKDRKYGELKPAIAAIALANENCIKASCTKLSVAALLRAVANLGVEFKKYGIA